MLMEPQIADGYRIARDAIDLAESHGLAPTPMVFEMLASYLTGERPTLGAAVKAALAVPDGDRMAALSAVYDANFSAEVLGEGLEKIRSGLASELTEVSSSIAKGVDGNLKLAAELRRSLRDLAGMVTREELQLVCRHLVYSGREQLSDTKDLASRLERTQFQLAEMQQELSSVRDNASRDNLTGLHNRQRFLDTVEVYTAEQLPFCLGLIELDGMSDLIAAWGRPVGDNILRGVGELLRRHSKGKDLAARIGPQDFAIVLPETPIDGAVALGESLRARFAKITWVSQSTDVEIGHRSLSIGIADWKTQDTAASVQDRAMARLQTAVAQGGNLVISEG